MSGAGAPRAWGWHSLTDEWAARVVFDADIRPHDLVLDIGAGRGALTRHLLAAGARVIAVELHPQRIAYLRRRFADTAVTVVCADASNLLLPRRPFRVVASPPYALTSALLRALLAPRSNLTTADLVLQRAAVLRCVDGRITGAGERPGRWTLSAGRALPRSAFNPAPRVDSAVLKVRRR